MKFLLKQNPIDKVYYSRGIMSDADSSKVTTTELIRSTVPADVYRGYAQPYYT